MEAPRDVDRAGARWQGMEAIFTALADPTIRGWYLVLCISVLVLPLAALARWYHARIGKTEGGRALMVEHERIGVPARSNPIAAFSALWRSLALARNISSNRYGDAARRLQITAYGVASVWLIANVVLFGVLIWADEVNHATR
jgi:hypothetical protein